MASDDALPASTTTPLQLALRFGAAVFVAMMVVELAIYGKGIVRALYMSVVPAIVVGIVTFYSARSRAASDTAARSH